MSQFVPCFLSEISTTESQMFGYRSSFLSACQHLAGVSFRFAAGRFMFLYKIFQSQAVLRAMGGNHLQLFERSCIELMHSLRLLTLIVSHFLSDTCSLISRHRLLGVHYVQTGLMEQVYRIVTFSYILSVH